MKSQQRNTSDKIKNFRKKVLTYYRKHGRDLPWRHTEDPYAIFVSEVMLQQTQVDRVVEKYQVFVKVFPHVKALARAPLEKVMRCWQGLGYNRRALYLKSAAEKIVLECESCIPSDISMLEKLPGIGPATARSIYAFAFDLPTVFIETNIRTVFIHEFFSDRTDVHDTELLTIVEQALDRKRPRQWYSALMDYGVMLKKTFPNPSRKSRHYVRQSPFKGSRRQVRGKIIKLILAEQMVSSLSIPRLVGCDRERTYKIIDELCSEGFLCRDGKTVKIFTK